MPTDREPTITVNDNGRKTSDTSTRCDLTRACILHVNNIGGCSLLYGRRYRRSRFVRTIKNGGKKKKRVNTSSLL